jgi:putative ABC transport system permease protein
MGWLRKRVGTAARETGFDREIAYHLDMLVEGNVAKGMSPQEARRQALVEFGGREQIKQQLREVHVSAFGEAVRANLRAAMRFIRRSPSFSATVILTLALGIGANSAVFSAIDAVLLRPLPFPHGDQLVDLQQQNLKGDEPNRFVAPVRLEDWNRLNSSFEAISGYYTQDASLLSGALPEKITQAIVAPRFLQVWGILPAIGRDFSAEERRFGGPNAVLVSDRFWRSHLGADPNAAGKTIRLGSSSCVVVGVLPPSFLFPVRGVDIWEPGQTDAPYARGRDATWYTVIGRLKPGVTIARASADLATVQSQLGKQFPKTDGGLTVTLQPLKSVVLNGIECSLWLLYGSVSLLLSIACTNIAALLLARMAEREHEISIRYSLGATRQAIVGQLLTEVFILALAGSMLGLMLAAGAVHGLAMLSKELPRVEEIRMNWRIVGYSLSCALAATLACGLLPAIRSTRRGLSGSLAQSGRSQVSGRNSGQWTLVGLQVSLAVALLIGSGLLLRSFQALGRVNPGFDPEHVLTLRISGGWGETMDMGKLTQRIERTLEGLRGVRGVESAATSSTIPGNAPSYPTELRIAEGARDPNFKMIAETRVVSPEYFATVRIPVLQGEPCRGGMPDTAVVSRSYADRYFANSTPIGRHVLNATETSLMKPAEIRGIVGDARQLGIDSPPQPTVYWCFSAPGPDPYYLIRTQGDPAAMADTLRRKIHELEPGRAVSEVMPLEDHLSDRMAENRLRTLLLTLFAITAVALASLGIYGTISYLGRLRRREVGLRLALGALPAQIAGRFLLQGLRVTAAGCGVGVIVALSLSHLLTKMLYGVSNLDAVTYFAVVALILTVAGMASLLPAVRAARVDPTCVLREE